MKHPVPICASVFLALAAPNAIAAEAVEANTGETPTVYIPENFAQFAPRTALEMVERIPGFSIDDDDDGSRGFGQATGNVLINGQRVSGKSNGAESALGRIAIANVARVELLDGTALGIPGLSGQVVNVITRETGGVSGTWHWKGRVRENLPPTYNDMALSLSGGKGAVSWTVEAESAPERGADAGPERITDATGALIETRKEDYTHAAEYASLAGSLAWKPVGGNIANFSAKIGTYEPDDKEISKLFPVGGLEGRRLFQGSEDEKTVELSADYAFDLGPGRLKTITLARREESPTTDRVRGGNLDGANAFDSLFNQTVYEGEYILRGEYAWVPAPGRDWQVSLEGAFNFLEAQSQLFASEGGAPLAEIFLPNANSRVEEQRGELTVTHGRALSKSVSLQVSLGAEMSELSQTGDAENVRTFTRPKGFASLSWQVDPSLKLVTRLDREVGQLDFFDFISSVNLNQGNGSQGNSDIVPEQVWKISVSAEKDFHDWGAATLTMFGSDIEDIVDRVPIGTGDGPGNLDSAWRVGADLDATVKFAKLGLTGTQLTFHGEWRDSRVADPLTGVDRPINGDTIYSLNAELRRDIPETDWAVGIFLESYNENKVYRLDEVTHQGNQPAFSYVYVENKDLLGMTGTLTLGNILNQHDWYWRETYAPNRLGALLTREARSRDFGPIVSFKLKGTF
ncbi:TonB-dependent receptor plug domain-containing protein [Hyphomonas oceanitis]|uniref:TonB-dependent receptor plug domain-containing protein n=1 Tax=Hyphomonas oceanitis TaxID=81033 RepID=UPI0030017D09